jgi:hypothetical protein
MSEGCEAKPWPLPKHTPLEASDDATKTNSAALKENMKAGINSPSKAVSKKPPVNIDEKGANPNFAYR